MIPQKMLTPPRNSKERLSYEIGVDEAGRGPLFGPLVAAAVIWPSEEDWTDAHRELAPKIKDSKTVSAKKREKVAGEIKTLSLAWGVGFVSASEIDRFGATRANQLAFRRAIQAASRWCADAEKHIQIDGTIPIAEENELEHITTIIDGDAKLMTIAAASIIAKVEHDNWIVNWCKENIADAAKYDLLSCKGYGTAKHRQGILEHGYTEEHRRLYLRKLIPDIVVARYEIQDEDTS
jgi:ribonuclease HII